MGLAASTYDVDGGQVSNKNGLAEPTRLKPFDHNDKQMLRVVIETPKGSRNKFAFDPDEHLFELNKVLPSGLTFPYDFGFVLSTEGADGDPVDVLVLRRRTGIFRMRAHLSADWGDRRGTGRE